MPRSTVSDWNVFLLQLLLSENNDTVLTPQGWQVREWALSLQSFLHQEADEGAVGSQLCAGHTLAIRTAANLTRTSPFPKSFTRKEACPLEILADVGSWWQGEGSWKDTRITFYNDFGLDYLGNGIPLEDFKLRSQMISSLF